MASSVLIGILITFLVIVLILYLVQRLPIDGRTRQILKRLYNCSGEKQREQYRNHQHSQHEEANGESFSPNKRADIARIACRQ